MGRVKLDWTTHQNDATLWPVMVDEGGGEQSGDHVADALAQNIRRMRERRGMSYVELSERLTRTGRAIPVLGLRRIERGARRVDAGDLLALALVLGATPVDLLVSVEADHGQPYAITPEVTAETARVRDWIGGGFLKQPQTAADLAEAIAEMPQERAERLAAAWFEGNHRLSHAVALRGEMRAVLQALQADEQTAAERFRIEREEDLRAPDDEVDRVVLNPGRPSSAGVDSC